MEKLLKCIEEYDMEGAITKIIMIPDTDTNKREIHNIGMGVLYQEDITDYINTII